MLLCGESLARRLIGFVAIRVKMELLSQTEPYY